MLDVFGFHVRQLLAGIENVAAVNITAAVLLDNGKVIHGINHFLLFDFWHKKRPLPACDTSQNESGLQGFEVKVFVGEEGFIRQKRAV